MRPFRRMAVVASLPRETAPLVRRLGARPLEGERGTCRWCRYREVEVCILHAGVGARHMREGLHWIREHFSPEGILLLGFAGGLTPSLRAGDVIRAVRVVRFDERGWCFDVPLRVDPPSLSASVSYAGDGTMVTVGRPVHKGRLARMLPDRWHPAVVDMETADAARWCAEWGMPFGALRAVCDEQVLDPGLDLERLVDAGGGIRLSRVFRYLLSDPSALIRMIRLAPRSSRAARSLAEAACAFVEAQER